jgi:3-oxoacyl-[acyl-carrier protein] reductase
MNHEGNLSGKVAIVTGSSRGIGRAIAERLSRDGAAVAVNYVQREDLANEVVSRIRNAGGQAFPVQADISRVANIRRLFDETKDRFGRVDIVVQNSFLFHPVPMVEVTEEEFDTAFALNVKGTFFVLKEAAMRVELGGRIIYISSCATTMNAPNFSVYSSGKAAGEMLVKTLAQEVGARGITVNTVSPGFTLTDMLPADPAWRKMGAEMSVFKRLGEPEEVAEVVGFLATPQAGWITAQNIQASGGVG